MKINTDEKAIDKFLTRGVEMVYPSAEKLKEKLMSGERLRIYQGFDPTGPYLHVGHAMGIRAMKILQELGHEVIFLVGDYTAKVGDPDKKDAREKLTDEEIENNMTGWKEQAAQLIDFEGENPVLFKRNFEWLSKLKLNNVIELMSKMTVQQMLKREMFNRRIKEGNPIGLQEFIYPLMQGYDGVAMEVDIEIGGADQTFNMLVGRDLSRAYLNKEKFVRTNKMMDAPDGITMSKTKGNGINLGDSAEEMYGKAMSYPDTAIASGLELLTDYPIEKIDEIHTKIKEGINPVNFKKIMAFEVVKTIKGEVEAKKAEESFKIQFQEKGVPKTLEIFVVENLGVLDVLVDTKLVNSKAEARRKIDEGAVKINDEKITDYKYEIDFKNGEDLILKLGRKIIKICQ